MRKQSTRSILRGAFLRKIEGCKEDLRRTRQQFESASLFLDDLAAAVKKHAPSEPSYVYVDSWGKISLSFRVRQMSDVNPLIEACKGLGYFGEIRHDEITCWSASSADRTIRFKGSLEIEANLRASEDGTTCRIIKVGETTEVVTRPEYKVECS